MISKEFGKWVRSKRLDRGMTLVELAKKCELSYVTISNIELGKTKPSISTMRRLSESLDVDYFDIRQKLKGE